MTTAAWDFHQSTALLLLPSITAMVLVLVLPQVIR